MIVGLISCGAAKTSHPTTAASLYVGPVFRASQRYIVKHCAEWAILSAKHGLLMPSVVVEPYDVTLAHMTKEQRAAWANETRAAILARWPRHRFLVIAGERYMSAVEGLEIEAPFKGLSMGRLLSALKRAQ